MIRKASAIGLLFLCLACAPVKRYEVLSCNREGSSCSPQFRPEFTDTWVEYEDYEELRQDELRRAKNLMREPSLASIPKGGRIKVKVESSTFDSANLIYWESVVQDSSGKEIIGAGQHDHWPSYGETCQCWWNLMLLEVPKSVDDFVVLRVLDHLGGSRRDFLIRKNPNYKQDA